MWLGLTPSLPKLSHKTSVLFCASCRWVPMSLLPSWYPTPFRSMPSVFDEFLLHSMHDSNRLHATSWSPRAVNLRAAGHVCMCVPRMSRVVVCVSLLLPPLPKETVSHSLHRLFHVIIILVSSLCVSYKVPSNISQPSIFPCIRIRVFNGEALLQVEQNTLLAPRLWPQSRNHSFSISTTIPVLMFNVIFFHSHFLFCQSSPCSNSLLKLNMYQSFWKVLWKCACPIDCVVHWVVPTIFSPLSQRDLGFPYFAALRPATFWCAIQPIHNGQAVWSAESKWQKWIKQGAKHDTRTRRWLLWETPHKENAACALCVRGAVYCLQFLPVSCFGLLHGLVLRNRHQQFHIFQHVYIEVPPFSFARVRHVFQSTSSSLWKWKISGHLLTQLFEATW